MCEVQAFRTAPWGYPAKMIVDFVAERGFQWFSISAGDRLSAVVSDQAGFDGNYVAVPDERVDSFTAEFPGNHRASLKTLPNPTL